MNDYLPCPYYDDCFAWRDGRCVALTDNHFKNKDCPFYKTEDDLLKEQEKALKTLMARDRWDLIDRYAVDKNYERMVRVCQSKHLNTTDRLQ